MIFKFKTSNMSDAFSEMQDYMVEKDGKGEVFWVAELKKARARHSQSQRGYYFVICTICATKIGCTKEQAHEMICMDNNATIITLPNGKLKILPKSIRDFKTDEMSQMITKARQWALTELGIDIPTPEEYNEEMRMRLLNEYDKMFY